LPANRLLGQAKARPESKYVSKLVRANEVRKIEQTAAWDAMMSKESRREQGGKEAAFVTQSYMK
jgi:hypothetical protein